MVRRRLKKVGGGPDEDESASLLELLFCGAPTRPRVERLSSAFLSLAVVGLSAGLSSVVGGIF